MSTASPKAQQVRDGSIDQLLAGIGARDAAAWQEIVHRYQGLVLSRARRFKLPEPDVLDAVQTTWLRLAEHWHTIEFPEHLGGWLATTVHRECLKIVGARKNLMPDHNVVELVADPQAGPETRVVDADTAAAVRVLLRRLDSRHRVLLDALFGADPPPYAELSRRSGIPIGSIGPTRARSLRRLRALIEAQGLAPSA